MNRTVTEVQYIQKQSRVYVAFSEGQITQCKWFKAKGETALLELVRAARVTFMADGFASLERAS